MTNPNSLRIGHDERNAAIAALDEHLRAGRIDADEYGDRMAAASLAQTRAQLDPLFADLPAPHPYSDRVAPPAQWRGAPVRRQPRRRPFAIGGVLVIVALIVGIVTIVGTVATHFFWLIFLLPWFIGARHRHHRPHQWRR